MALRSIPDISGKSKAIPVEARIGPEVSRRFKLPEFMTVGTCG
jgi:hypothetical protein